MQTMAGDRNAKMDWDVFRHSDDEAANFLLLNYNIINLDFKIVATSQLWKFVKKK
jgi:hypothetical protein